jgi:hypothetical protein
MNDKFDFLIKIILVVTILFLIKIFITYLFSMVYINLNYFYLALDKWL